MIYPRPGNRKTVIVLGAVSLLLVILGLVWQFWYLPYTYSKIQSFEDCAKKYPVMESYPAQCNSPDGRHFVQTLTDEEKKSLIPPTP